MNIIDDRKSIRFKRRERSYVVTEVVIHHSWTKTLDRMIKALKAKDCGTHYAIDRDGTIHYLTDERYRVAHCVSHNELAIGIDIIRGAGQHITDAQYSALNDLLVDIVDRHKWKCPILHVAHIYFHRDLRPTACPGSIDDDRILF